MKLHPIHQFDADLRSSTRTRDFLSGLKKSIDQADQARAGWIQKCDHFRRRRYGMEFRNPTYPWPGSSSIVPPLIDKKIDELKPQYLNLITAAHPPVTVLAVDPMSQEQAPNVELWFEWLIKFGSPRFIEEAILFIDDLLEIGRGCLKSIWHYETAPTPETIRPANLPPRLRQLVVTARSEAEADAMFEASGKTAKVMTRAEFDEKRDLIQKVIQREFDLDPEEPQDREAISEVMRWFRAGANEPLQISKRDCRLNVPGIVAISPKDLIVPEWTTDIEQAEFITHRMWFTPTQMRAKARNSVWDEKAVKEILERRKKRGGSSGGSGMYDQERTDEAMREGVSLTQDDQIEFNETCTWFASKENGEDTKVVILTAKDAPDVPVKMYAYQRPSGLWPHHTATFEMNKRRWYSPRGVPEKLDDLEYEIIQQKRAKLNRMTIANSPTFTYEIGSNVNPSNFRWIPGQFMAVRRQGAVQALEVPNLDISFDREEQILRTWAEEYLGGVDFGLNSALSSNSDSRTATEINAIQGRARQSLSLRGTLFQRCWQDVYREMFDMFIHWGDPQVYVQVTGAQPMKLTREQLQGRYEFIPTGTIGETDPVMEAQKALARITLLTQAKQAGVVGDEYDINLGQALLDWIEKDDIRAARRLVRKRSSQEIKQVQEARAKQQQEMLQQQAAMATITGKPPKQIAGAASEPISQGAR